MTDHLKRIEVLLGNLIQYQLDIVRNDKKCLTFVTNTQLY